MGHMTLYTVSKEEGTLYYPLTMSTGNVMGAIGVGPNGPYLVSLPLFRTSVDEKLHFA